VTWTFWLFSAIFGYGWAKSLHRFYEIEMGNPPAMIILLAIWIAMMFVSILIHELGHTLAFRFYGVESSIVLYHMGGLAIPDGMGRWDGARRRTPSKANQIVISAAGPALQLLLGIVAAGVGLGMGYQCGFPVDWIVATYFPDFFSTLVLPNNAAITAILHSTVFMSILWAVLNLIPVLPLDGGQIARNAIGIYQRSDGMREALMVSVGFGAIAALYFFQSGQRFAGILFVFLAFQNFQTLQQYRSTRW
jgi:Zn-dependent protease